MDRAKLLGALMCVVSALSLTGPAQGALARADSSHFTLNCAHVRRCADVADSTRVFGYYVGHDEPALNFYSATPGSGNSNQWTLKLPQDPPTLPLQNGSGGTDNFQLHPAFWFSMIVCDTQSSPEFTNTCTPDSEANIFDNPSPAAPDFIGKHPGAGFVEMQFYPPGWVSWPNASSCDATKWCAALNIDSLSYDDATGVANNPACRGLVGDEPVNFAFITRSGVPHGPPDPVNSTVGSFTPNPATDVFMSSGDVINLDMHDTAAGLTVLMNDVTSGAGGSMTASAANGFAQVNYNPAGASCTDTPYNFHPMYSTSSPLTRATWLSHSSNVAFSDEIGHWEYCGAADCSTRDGDADDSSCFGAGLSLLVGVGGCTNTDSDFDGTSYQPDWPGSTANPAFEQSMHPSPIIFSSPTVSGTDFSSVAFETDIPAFEGGACNNLTGTGCVDPPPGANFYPIYSTRGPIASATQSCFWQLGGANIQGTTATFGTTAAAQYGPVLPLLYIFAGGGSGTLYENFQQALSTNPCVSSTSQPAPATPTSYVLPTSPLLTFGTTGCGSSSPGSLPPSVMPGTQFAITAIPCPGHTFLGWTGGPCDGKTTNPCTLTIITGILPAITANFSP